MINSYKIGKTMMLVSFLILFFTFCAYAQQQVSGKITSANNQQPLIGVSISVKGAQQGTVSEVNGHYTITADDNAILVFSYLGFKTQKIQVNGRTNINVTMEKFSSNLNEVVVVGYGTQKKANLTGSVATVSGDDLTKRSVNNPVNLLQGKVPGLEIAQAYGKPGNAGNSIKIRGLGTFSGAGSKPLVLIDGIAGDMSNLDPNNIASITVLKDAASSAIYGARAANGVILVTTKKGRSGTITIEYKGNIQAQQPTRLPKLLYNSADYMEFWNEGRIRAGLTPYFTQKEIDAFRNHPNDPVHYPNYNWVKARFHTAFVQKHHLNVSGGSEKTTFNIGLGFYNQNGVISNYGFKKYNVLLSIDSKIQDWISVGGKVSLNKRDIISNYIGSSNGDYALGVFGSGPNYTPTMTLANGETVYVARYSKDIGEWTVRNPVAADVAGFNKNRIYNVSSQIYVDVDINKNLKWLTKGAVTYENNFNKLRESPIANYFFKDSSYAHNNAPVRLGVRDNFNQNLFTTLYSTLTFNKTFNNIHFLKVLIGYSQESNYHRQLGGHRIHFSTPTLAEINAASADGQTTSGTANEWAIQSLFGRVSYNYKGKYLLEGNIRYDGTSRIAPKSRWGIFPSVSAGWRISEEQFMEDVNWLSNLKIRASIGQLGNQNIGLYPYQDILSLTAYPYGNSLESGVQLTRLTDKSLEWETTTMTDFGLDLNIKHGLFTATFDWYNKVTDGILYQLPIPASVGLSSPTVNYGRMRNRGVEFQIGHNHQIGAFSYGINLNFSANRNEVLRVKSPSYGKTIVKEGLPFNSFYLIKWIGIFQSREDINKSPEHPYDPKPGDLKYQDANKDGTIDADDRVVVPGAYPKFYYGGSIDLSWKNFNLSVFFQGVEGQKFYMGGGGWGYSPYVQGSPPRIAFVENRWTPTHHTNKYPAMYISGYAPVTGTPSTYWLLDASYLRLKNLRIGYELPKRVIGKLGLKGCRVYISGDNLLTITPYPGGDPERGKSRGRYSAYPQITTYTFGLDIKL